MLIEFNEKDHVYSINGEIASISVTELLAKHGLAPNYSGVDKNILAEAREKGKEVHKDLELILNEVAYVPKTKQGEQFAKWVSKNLDCGVGEQLLGYEREGLLIGGTADVLGISKDRTFCIVGDHKNTAAFHREYVTWQVSLLNYFAKRLGKEKINGKVLNWKGAKEFYCFHYDPKTTTMTVYDLDPIPDEEIERLLECEYNGTKYERAVLAIDPLLQEMFVASEQSFKAAEVALKELQSQRDKLREKLLALFEAQKIRSWESPNKELRVTYVPAAETLKVDEGKLKTKYPQVYSECQKLSKRKAYIKITQAKGDEE